MVSTDKGPCQRDDTTAELSNELHPPATSRYARIILVGLPIAVFIILFWSHHFIHPPQVSTPVQLFKADGDQYLRLAFHLHRHGVLSQDSFTLPNPTPTSYRLPGYPFFLSLWMASSPYLRHLDPTGLLGEDSLPDFLRLIHAQVFMYFLLTLCCGVMVALITRSWLATHFSLFLIGFEKLLWNWSRHVTLEVLLCFLVAAVSLMLLLCVTKRRLVWYFISGISLAMLSLTRGHFQYFLPVGMIFLLIYIWRNDPKWRQDILALCLFGLVPFLAVQAWKARNDYHFGRWYLTDRGGLILDIRAGLNMVRKREYWASFLYFSRSPYFGRILEKHFDPSEYERFKRDEDNPLSIYQHARRRRLELVRKYGSMAAADKIQLAEALGKIKAHPVRHFLMCFPLAIRGLGGIKPCLLGLGAIGAMIAFSVIRRRWDIGAVLLPSIFSYGFCTAFTHNIARYNILMVPIVYVSMVLVGFFLSRRIWHTISTISQRRTGVHQIDHTPRSQ